MKASDKNPPLVSSSGFKNTIDDRTGCSANENVPFRDVDQWETVGRKTRFLSRG